MIIRHMPWFFLHLFSTCYGAVRNNSWKSGAIAKRWIKIHALTPKWRLWQLWCPFPSGSYQPATDQHILDTRSRYRFCSRSLYLPIVLALTGPHWRIWRAAARCHPNPPRSCTLVKTARSNQPLSVPASNSPPVSRTEAAERRTVSATGTPCSLGSHAEHRTEKHAFRQRQSNITAQ